MNIREGLVSDFLQRLSEVSFHLLKTFCLMELLEENIISN